MITLIGMVCVTSIITADAQLNCHACTSHSSSAIKGAVVVQNFAFRQVDAACMYNSYSLVKGVDSNGDRCSYERLHPFGPAVRRPCLQNTAPLVLSSQRHLIR